MSKIVLTGTTGQLGSSVLRHILTKKLIPTDNLVISLYNPDSAPKDIVESGIPVRRGDFNEPQTLLTAFEGADVLFIVSYPGFSRNTEVRIKAHGAAIEAAKKVGIKHIVYTSLSFGGKDGETSTAVVTHSHIETVKLIKQSGLEYTIVREATYAEIWYIYAGLIRLDNLKPGEEIEIVIPADGATRFCAREDLGEATARIIANLKNYKNQSVVLHGPYGTSVSDIAKLIENRTGRKVNLRILPEDEVLAYHMKKQSIGPNTTEEFLRDWLTFFPALAAGEADYVDDTIEQVLGRKARGVADMVDELFGTKIDGDEELALYAK